ncbi:MULTISPECIES: adenine phosphoribosyltransferase [unclassified Candidatus Frackibacter]|uniref:adenine phosphoribosyltransferase n=1 Tax=unclassified Candidatus Frackibacter TaxID=2648818 RepID=UPI000799CF7C|nr:MULTISPECIES: adenine phosphoribosyltransferase [unclassified Candidatus Frackibacter]KXS44189.1 MAG: adenine phosphoribosyltransferase [Candidatus Frackibacter sp. T328-2]SDC64421.1 adenine phosphoribosyltransferase [Candidatus Frackibacter sp. WG11]SEM77478.1 adenine phosphoribosyltransferase [Candidatus Frackibacter sp. WG12]SFL88588.1 adenine phosphoribosyltransferase [Candidatus Frackibacter sp. WG13]
MDLNEKIRVIKDFPEEGIEFKDITTLLKDPEAYQYAIQQFVEQYKDMEIDVIVGIEARGFLVGAPLALELDKSFVPARKEGKLPAEVARAEYDLEYGSNVLEIHRDAVEEGQKVLIIDDLLATGGTVKATAELIEEIGGEVVGLGFLLELSFLKGREKLQDYDLYTIIRE